MAQTPDQNADWKTKLMMKVDISPDLDDATKKSIRAALDELSGSSVVAPAVRTEADINALFERNRVAANARANMQAYVLGEPGTGKAREAKADVTVENCPDAIDQLEAEEKAAARKGSYLPEFLQTAEPTAVPATLAAEAREMSIMEREDARMDKLAMLEAQTAIFLDTQAFCAKSLGLLCGIDDVTSRNTIVKELAKLTTGFVEFRRDIANNLAPHSAELQYAHKLAVRVNLYTDLREVARINKSS